MPPLATIPASSLEPPLTEEPSLKPALAPATEKELPLEDSSGPAPELPVEPALLLPSEEFVLPSAFDLFLLFSFIVMFFFLWGYLFFFSFFSFYPSFSYGVIHFK